MRGHRPQLWQLTVTIALVGFGCQLVAGIERPEGVPNPGMDARAANDPCEHANVPAPPKDDVPGANDLYVFVMRDMVMPLARDAGFDLDRACTCQPDLRDGAPACTTSSSSPICDGPGGIDNTFAGSAAIAALDVTQTGETTTDEGRPNTLIAVFNYNGQANDKTVSVAIIPTLGLRNPAAGCVDAPDRSPSVGPFLRPSRDGCDQWRPEPNTFITGSGGAFGFAQPGYVSNFRLVVEGVGEAAAPRKVAFLGHFVEMSDIKLVATLQRTADDQFALKDGRAVGRARIPTLAGAIGADKNRCRGPEWPAIKDTLCKALDVRSDVEEAPFNKPCNAFSMTWGFNGERALAEDVSLLDAASPFATNDCAEDVCPDAGCPLVGTPAQLCAK